MKDEGRGMKWSEMGMSDFLSEESEEVKKHQVEEYD